MDVSWMQVVPVGTAALAYGLAAPLGGSGFIAAFVAGFVFGAVLRTDERHQPFCSRSSVSSRTPARSSSSEPQSSGRSSPA